MKIALGLEYDGSQFCGWQSQPDGCGVQDVLEAALARMACHPVRAHAAGRTDAGVHALMQVVHFHTDTQRLLNAWVRGVNALLNAGVRVLWACEVNEVFHARFSAEQRSYQYLLQVSPVAPAVLHGKVGWYHRPLDFGAMREAAALLLGEHDFSAFRAAECQAKSPVKSLYRAEVSQRGNMILLEFTADAFLHHMVRNLVGSLVYVGKGKYPPSWMAELLASKNRTLAPPTSPPEGLYLTGVVYPAGFGLPPTERSLAELTLPAG